MLTEWLERQTILPLLTEKGRNLVPTANDRDAWNRIKPEYEAEIRSLKAAYADQPYPMRQCTDFLAFTRNGSRKADEEPYFFRRRKLCAAVLSCCLDPEDSLDDVINGLWCICEESSWVISAHNVNPIPGAPEAAEMPLPDPDRPYVDLFSAQTAMILALTVHLLDSRLDKVSPMLRRRVWREMEKRVFTPFMETDDFWWMGVRRKDLNNWTPWILSNLYYAACVSPMPAERLGKMLERGCRMLDRWLKVMPEDGGCDEGAGYWNMAGGALLDCLEVLEHVTDGRMCFWEEPKIRRILAFPLTAQIGNGWFMNFADCDARPFISGERLEFAGQKIGNRDLEMMGYSLRGTVAEQLNDTPHLTRTLSLLFHESGRNEERDHESWLLTEPDAWLPDLQVRVVRRGAWTLCAKGGHNGESHNHNDVGSFMLYLDGEPAIVDAGNMIYTAKTFSDQRYTLWNTRSAYHNLPLIGGVEQKDGQRYAASRVELLQDGLALNLENAYPAEAEAQTLRRVMSLSAEGLTLRDTISLNRKKEITWVFMLRYRPALKEQTVSSGKMVWSIPQGWRVDVEEIPVTDARMARSYPGSLWRLQLTAPQAETQELKLRITGKDEDGRQE